jgi:pimeloyl-ACP methyl ester carboxylesterase
MKRFVKQNSMCFWAMVWMLFFVINAASVMASGEWSVDPGDQSTSFWKDNVHYPYDVKYGTGKDNQGVAWEIAYMDEYSGNESNPSVLVLIHGKGVFGGYFGYVIKQALSKGLRVIVPDLPHYGKSIPGNLDKPLARTLQDTREAIHDLIVNQLGVSRASYMGHSMGGQWVIGYALTYPDAVEKLILEGAGGMEEFPTNIKIGNAFIGFFDPGYLRDLSKWEAVWSVPLQKEFAKTESDIRLFYYFKKKDPATGKIETSESGYFKKETPMADFVTQVRVKMINGHPQEFKNYATTYIRDVYSMGVEVRKEDPESIVKRMRKELNIPVFVAYGEEEPFIPTTTFSGNTSMLKDIILPFYNAMKEKGVPPVVKLYPGAAHFVHTDAREDFTKDVMDFVLTGTVEKSMFASSGGGGNAEEMAALKMELSALKDEVKLLKKSSDNYSDMLKKFDFDMDYRLAYAYKGVVDAHKDNGAQTNDDVRGFDQLLRLKMDYKASEKASFHSRILLYDNLWKGDRRSANAAGSNVDAHEDNISLDYGYLEMDFGSGINLRVGRQIASWGHNFNTGDDRRDRIFLSKQIGYAKIFAIYDKRQEGQLNENKDDGDMYSVGAAAFYKGWLMGSYVAFWKGYAAYDSLNSPGLPQEGYVLDDVWCVSPFVDGKIGQLEVKSTISFLDGNGRGDGKLNQFNLTTYSPNEDYAGLWANRSLSGFIRLGYNFSKTLKFEVQGMGVWDGGLVDPTWDSFSCLIQNDPRNDPNPIRISGVGGLGFDGDNQFLFAGRLSGKLFDKLGWKVAVGYVDTYNEDPDPMNFTFDNLYPINDRMFYDLQLFYTPIKNVGFFVKTGYIAGDNDNNDEYYRHPFTGDVSGGTGLGGLAMGVTYNY